MGRKDGVRDAQLLDLTNFENSPEFSDIEKLVLRYSTAMTQTPVQVKEELFETMRGHFSEKQLVELTSAIAWENYRAVQSRSWDRSGRVLGRRVLPDPRVSSHA